MSNKHRFLRGSQLHNPKGFDDAAASTRFYKDGGSNLFWFNETHFPNALDYVSCQSAPPTEVAGNIYVLDDTGIDYDINTIAWQSANTIRYSFNGTPNLSAIASGDYLVVSGSSNSSNDGIFFIETVNDASDYIDINNPFRLDATDDEATDASGTAYYTLEEWDGATKGNHVRYDGNLWVSSTAQDGALCYDQANSLVRVYDSTNENWDTSLGGGATSLWTQSGSDIYYNSGNVGIGTTPISGKALAVDGSSVISGQLDLNGSGDSKLKLINSTAQDTSGNNYMTWYQSNGSDRRGYLGFTDPNTFNINVQESAGTSQIVLDADEIILNSSTGTDSSTITTGVWQGTAIADAYIASAATWNAKADVTGSPLNNQVAVFTNGTTIEGDSSLTWNTAALTVTDGTDTTEVRDKFISVKSESDDANLYLYGYGGGSNSGEIYLAGSRGTIASPTATQSGDTLGEIGIFGAVPGLRPGARILVQATENYVDTSNYGTKFVVQTTKNGTATLATRYTIDGDGDHTFTGNVEVQGSGEILKLETSAGTGDNYMTFHDAAQKGLIGYESGSDDLIIENGEIGASIIFKNAHTGAGGTTFDGLEIEGTGDVNMSGIVTAISGLNSNGAVVFTSSSEAMQLHRWTDAQQTTNLFSHGASQQGEVWFNTSVNTFKGWNGSSVVDLAPKGTTTVKNIAGNADITLYSDTNIEINWDVSSEDIEFHVLTNPSSGRVHLTAEVAGTITSVDGSTGTTPANIDAAFSTDEMMDILINAPDDTSYPAYHIKLKRSNVFYYTNSPFMVIATKYTSYD